MSRDFTGATDRLDWASIDNLAGDALTISVWVYLDGLNAATNSYIFCAHDNGDTQYGIVVNLIGSSADPKVDVLRHGATADYIWFETNTSFDTGGWHHILITNNGGVLSGSTAIYTDGTSRATSFTNGVGAETAHSGSWSLGGRIYSDTRNLDGRIAEIALWSAVLDGTTIAALASGDVPRRSRPT